MLGLTTVREAIENPQLGSFIENAIFQEVIAGMAPGQEVQNAEYARAILEASLIRLSNINLSRFV